MKYLLKVYCIKEVKHIKHDLKDAYTMQQVLLLFLKSDYKLSYNHNSKSETISVMVDNESTYKWLLAQIEKILKRSYFTINTNSY